MTLHVAGPWVCGERFAIDVVATVFAFHNPQLEPVERMPSRYGLWIGDVVGIAATGDLAEIIFSAWPSCSRRSEDA